MVTLGSLEVTLRVTIDHLRVTIVHIRVTISYLKATVVHIRVTLGHLRVTVGYFFSISKHKANTTELHPKVRQTCISVFCIYLRVSLIAQQSAASWPGLVWSN